MDFEKLRYGTEFIKRGFARMQKGDVIMDITTPEQARIAEETGAVAVMDLRMSCRYQKDRQGRQYGRSQNRPADH